MVMHNCSTVLSRNPPRPNSARPKGQDNTGPAPLCTGREKTVCCANAAPSTSMIVVNCLLYVQYVQQP
jgi:hypothetical protein